LTINTITKNTASNNNHGIYLDSSISNNITNNTASSNKYNGIFLWDSDINTVTNNTGTSNGNNGIDLYRSNNNTIVNNTLSSNKWVGIFLLDTSSNTITNNEMENNGIFIMGDMLKYWNTHNIDITNTINGKPVRYWKNQTGGSVPLGAGQVILANSTNVVVENQNVSYGSAGIELGFSNSNTIVNNTASSNKLYGIDLHFSNSNTINNNILSSNKLYGIYLEDSSNNGIYHNNIINNINQASDNTNNGNQWDNSYPSGGNYWTDYTGIDLNSTANQDVPPPDGIGDSPYIIDSDSQDNYPLFYPVGDYIFLNQGWNLISIPNIQTDSDIKSILLSINGSYDAVQWHNASDLSDPWKHHKVAKPFGNDLFELNETMGFWIHITESGGVLFEYTGTQPTSN
jgi:parallel beta-helix repeat protein